MIRLLAGLGLLAWTGAAWGEPGDFVRGRVVQVPASESAVRVILPQDVYEWVTRPDLGDLRAFNGASEEVPYLIRRPQDRKEFSDWMDLPVFALPLAQADPGRGARVNIQLDDGGAVVAVDGAALNPTDPRAYLFDASKMDRPYSEMRVRWDGSGAGFVGKFRLDASANLNDWRVLVRSATLADLRAEGEQVRVDAVEFEPTRARYLRLTQLEGSQPIELDTASVRSRQTELPDRHWKLLVGDAVKDGYEFDTGGLFPLDRVAVTMEGDTYLVVVRLFSRARPKESWRPRGEHTFYSARVNGSTATGPAAVVTVRDRLWRVEVVSGTDRKPRLRVGWLPDEVILLNQAPGPFLVAYGRAGLVGRQWPVAQMLAEHHGDVDLDRIPLASLSPPTTLGGPEMRIARRAPVDWQTVLLWSLLVLGVVVVGGFAVRLVRASG